MVENLRNIAIIAHVDHGKTTLIDKLLQQSDISNNRISKIDRIMDSNVLEKERGITITAKNIAIKWRNYHINIVDTPGHADFSGEVERVMSMVDSVLLVVDATDGPMPQTRFVTKKAFNYGLNPIVVVNKIDRIGSRPDWVVNQIFDLFVSLDANENQLDFPIIYTSALKGIAGEDYNNMAKDMTPLYMAISKYVCSPNVDLNGSFQMQISQLDYDNYLGVIGIGRIKRGKIIPNKQVIIINKDGKKRNGKINNVLTYMGLDRINSNLATAGNIIAITGLGPLNISDTICDIDKVDPLPVLNIDKPTISMFFCVNDSPFSGQEGKYITSSQILERLKKELLYNVALCVEQTNNLNVFCVSGRGELHLAVLIENMRREGFELAISRPKVVFREINGIQQEPFENLIIDVEKEYYGNIIQSLSERRGKLKNMILDHIKKRVRLDYIISSRRLIGFRSEFINITSGNGSIYTNFSHYENISLEKIKQRKNGVLIANSQGKSLAFALCNLQERGNLFITHGEKVYTGQIIGIHKRNNDLTVNCLIGKKLTNMRASGSDEAIVLIPPINLSLEQALEFINDDELVEVTPLSIRIRKKLLTENDRKKALRLQKNNNIN